MPSRAVPDVSYNAGAGIAIYSSANGGWVAVGGTSAGAPQWAAIEALGGSASDVDLYNSAKSAYSTNFRDITSGSNGFPGFPATTGYDLATGLGSPKTDDFGSLLVSPTSGPPGGSVTLSGIGFTASSSMNISYLQNSAWVPLASNVPTSASQGFTYNFTAPDIMQKNPAGDNPQLSDNIIFQAVDNGNGYVYNTTVPYLETRRGLTQFAGATAVGIYGNNTNFATTNTTFVQNGELVPIVGSSFYPGTASLLWDCTTSLGTTTVNPTGLLNATIQVPTTTAGQHTLTIYDYDGTNFCVNVTRLPMVTNDYDGAWHTTNFTINLTPDFNGVETSYSINSGAVENVSANGQPFITTEGSNNTLEYWSTWNIYGTGNMALQNETLTGIELDLTPPQGSLLINNGDASTSSTSVILTINANDAVSGMSQMQFSNDDTRSQSSWQPYAATANWQLTDGNGVQTVYCQIQDNAGLTTTLTALITLSIPQPTPTPTLAPSPSPSPIPSATTVTSPLASPEPTQSTEPSTSPSPTPSTTTQVPEFGIQMVLVMLALMTLLFAAVYFRKTQKPSSGLKI